MVRGTTPTFILTVGDSEEIDLSTATAVYATVRQRGKVITKTGSALTIEGNVVSFRLTEAESLLLTEGEVSVQVNWTVGNRRIASDVVNVNVSKQLLMRAIT